MNIFPHWGGGGSWCQHYQFSQRVCVKNNWTLSSLCYIVWKHSLCIVQIWHLLFVHLLVRKKLFIVCCRQLVQVFSYLLSAVVSWSRCFFYISHCTATHKEFFHTVNTPELLHSFYLDLPEEQRQTRDFGTYSPEQFHTKDSSCCCGKHLTLCSDKRFITAFRTLVHQGGCGSNSTIEDKGRPLEQLGVG